MDSQGRLFVADRGNNRIQIFTQDGEHIDTWYQFSRNSGIWIDKSNDWLYAIDSSRIRTTTPAVGERFARWQRQNRRSLVLRAEHVSPLIRYGWRGIHGRRVTVDSAGNVYAGEVGPIQGMTRFVPRLIP